MMSRGTATIPLILRLVNETTSIVNIAGSMVRKILQNGNINVNKGKNYLQTKADRAVQQYITQRLYSQFPKIAIIGEKSEDVSESINSLLSQSSHPSQCPSPFPEILFKRVPDHISSISEDEVVICIDPLDGTTEFTQDVTVLVGMAVNGHPIGGVIHQPFYKTGDSNTGRTMWGIPEVGFGGFKIQPPPKGKRILITQSHTNTRVEAALMALEPDSILRVGGAGHKAILLMEGQAHAYVYASSGYNKWDTCAPEAILRASGGCLTDMDGHLYKYTKAKYVNETVLLATAPGEDHDWYVQHGKLNRKSAVLKNSAFRENIWTVPNFLCVIRMGTAPVLAYMILNCQYGPAIGLFAFAGATDLLDGWIARVVPGQSSVMGSFLDPMADKILVGTLFISLTYMDLIPVPLTALIIARDAVLILAGFYIRYQSLEPPRTLTTYFNAAHPTAQLAPTFISKINTVIQLGLIGVTMLSTVLPYDLHLCLTAMWVCTATTTIGSGLSYIFAKDTVKLLRKSSVANIYSKKKPK